MRARAVTTAPKDQVWELLADIPGWPSWTPTVTSAEPMDPDAPLEVGASFRMRQPRLSPAVWTVVEWEPGRSFTWRATARGVTTTAGHRLATADDGGTEIVLDLDWTGPLTGIARLFYGRLTQRYIDTEARSLADRAAR